MFMVKSKPRNWKIIAASLFAVAALGSAEPCRAQSKVIATYTFPDTPIKGFQNKRLEGSVANDRKVLLGSVGSDLWRGPKDPRDEFWMVTDRGPNGQIAVDGRNRRTFWVPEFNPTIAGSRSKTKRSAFSKPYRSSANQENR